MVRNFKYVLMTLFSISLILVYGLDLAAKPKAKSEAQKHKKNSSSTFSEANVKESLEASRSGKKQNSQIETIGEGDKFFLKAKAI